MLMGGSQPNRQIFPPVIAGLLIGIITVILCFSYASLIFSGELAPFLASGIGIMLRTAFVIGLATSLVSRFVPTIAIPQDRIAPLLSILVSSIMISIPAASIEVKYYTIISAIFMATLLTGITFVIVGKIKMGALMRYIPYPVMGGFLAGSGLLLLRGSLPVLTGMPLASMDYRLLFEQHHLLRWLPGLAMGLLIFIVMRRSRHPFALPLMIAFSVGIFYVLLWKGGYSIAQAQYLGWLFPPFPGGAMTPFHMRELITGSDIHAVLGTLPGIVTIAAVSIISFLLSASALENDSDHDVDFNGELISAGRMNILGALCGGMVGFQSLSLTGLNIRLGVRSRLAGIVASLVPLAVLIFGTRFFSFIPVAIIGSLLIYLGLSFLAEWLYDEWFRLPLTEYLLIVLILVTIGFFGYLVGVAVGTVAAVIFFAIKYSRINVVRGIISGSHISSNVDRPAEAQTILRERGDQIAVVKLQGYLFFGTASDVLDAVRSRTEKNDAVPVRFVVLDLSNVNGIDSSAAAVFAKLGRLSQKYHLTLVLAGMNESIHRRLQREGILHEVETAPLQFTDLDHALEWCEKEILKASRSGLMRSLQIADVLDSFFHNSIDMARFRRYLKRIDVKPGDCLIRQRTHFQDLYFIESGTFSVELGLDSGNSIRIRTIGPGSVVGEMALYLKGERTASVIANEQAVVYEMSDAALRQMTADDPAMAAGFHRQMASILAARLLSANTAIRQILE